MSLGCEVPVQVHELVRAWWEGPVPRISTEGLHDRRHSPSAQVLVAEEGCVREFMTQVGHRVTSLFSCHCEYESSSLNLGQSPGADRATFGTGGGSFRDGARTVDAGRAIHEGVRPCAVRCASSPATAARDDRGPRAWNASRNHTRRPPQERSPR